MELYKWNIGLGQADDIIEKYESFIWTDRYSAFGDFQVVTDVTAANLSALAPGTFIGFDKSDRLMIVKSLEKKKDANGRSSLLVKGKSLEAMLADRAARSSLTNATWPLTGTVGGICTYIVDYICRAGSGISSSDVIPGLTTTNSDTTTASMTVSIKSGTLYDAVKSLCDSFDMGFRIRRIINPDVAHGAAVMTFEVYKGVDRSPEWGVSFSEQLENLSDASYLRSKDGYKNVAYVFAPNGTRIVTATGASAVSGWARNTMLVDASDITTAAGATLQAQLLQRGLDALSACKEVKLIDGTVNPVSGTYKFGTDYNMGDIVAVTGDDGIRTPKRVTEYIWSYDDKGFQSYPTLSSVGGV